MLAVVALLLMHARGLDHRVRQFPKSVKDAANGAVANRQHLLIVAGPEHLLLQRMHAGVGIGFPQRIQLVKLLGKQVADQQ